MKRFTIFIAFLLTIHCQAQYNDSVFMIAYGGNGYEEAVYIKQLHRSYFIVGNTSSIGNGNKDLFILKTDAYGKPLFTKTIGSGFIESANAATQTPQKDILIAAISNNENPVYHPLITKIDTMGNGLWQKHLAFSNWTIPTAILQHHNRIYLAGHTYAFNHQYSTIFLTALSSNGDSLWTKTVANTSHQEIKNMYIDNTSGIFMVGSTENGLHGRKDILLVKSDTNGNVLWTQNYGTPFDDIGNDVTEDPDNRIIVVGQSAQDSTGIKNDATMIIADKNGNLNNQMIDLQPGNDAYIKIKPYYNYQTSDTGFCILGTISEFGAGKQDFRLLITNKDGGFVFAPTFGSTENEIPVSFDFCSDGGYALLGNTNSYYNKLSKIFFARTDKKLNTTSSGSFINTYINPKPSQPAEIIRIYPNPFGEQITINSDKKIDRIEIYDLIGNCLLTKEPDLSTIDTRNLNPGYYFIKVYSNNNVAVIKGIKP